MPNRKQLTKEERGKDAFKIHTEISVLEKNRRVLALEMGKRLSEIYETQGFKDILGDEDATWKEYLAQPNVFFSRLKARKLFSIARKYLNELQLDMNLVSAVPTERLEQLCNLITAENSAELLAKAALLGPADWKITLNELKGVKEIVCTEHKIEIIKKCEICGQKQNDNQEPRGV